MKTLQDKFYIVSYWTYKDEKTFVGGLRPYRLYDFLKQKGVDVSLITPKKYGTHELVVEESKWLKKFSFITRAFPPDPMVFWAIKLFFYIRKLNRGKHFFIFITCPPNGLSVLGLLLKWFKVNCTVILDYRDLWTQHPIYKPPFTKKFIDPFLEKQSFKLADIITLNTEWDKGLNEKLFPFIKDKSLVMRNGYDELIPNRSHEPWSFIYAGGTTAGQATRRVSEFMVSLNKQGFKASCDFYGEYDQQMETLPHVVYKGIIAPDQVPVLLSGYKFGFIYLPVGSEEGGRIAQKFYDYISTGVIPICFRPSKEMVGLMDELQVGIKVMDDSDVERIVDQLEHQQFKADQSILKELSRFNQFDKIYQYLLQYTKR